MRFILKTILLISVFFFSPMGITEPGNSIDFESTWKKLNENSKYELTVTPPKNHHLNEKAPHRVAILKNKSKGPSALQVLKSDQLEISEFALKTHFNISSFDKNTCFIELKIYLCDNANTYCIPKEKTIPCNSIQDTK